MKKIYSTLVLAILALVISAQPCSKLFFSEYVEGSGNNKALEIYNPTINPVDLSGYSIIHYNNGSDTARYKFLMSGNIAPGGTYVIVNTQAGAYLKDVADSISASPVFGFNGDDVLALLNGTDTLDRIGRIGNPKDTAILFGDSLGRDHSFVRKATIQEGAIDWSVGSLQWDAYPKDTIRLGSHTMNPCAAPSDTLADFSPTSYSFTGVNGSYTLNINLNTNHTDAYSVDVEIKSGDASNLNNYVTQTLDFGAGITQATVPLTITNDTTGGGSNVIVFRLTNETGGVKIGEDSLFTLTLNAPVVGPNGLSNIQFQQAGNIYPNPNNGQFIIEMNSPADMEVKLFDLSGRMVYASKESSSKKISIQAQDLESGLYIVELKTGSALMHTRIQVQ